MEASGSRQRPELKRILSENVDLIAHPLTAEEDVSMWQVVQQFETGWRVENILKRGELKSLARDAATFFELPLPLAVWKKTKRFRNPRFVWFVERAIERRGRLSGAGDFRYDRVLGVSGELFWDLSSLGIYFVQAIYL